MSYGSKQLIYSSAGGSTDVKTSQELYDLIEQMAMNSYPWGSTRGKVKPPGVHSIDMMTVIKSRFKAMIDKKFGSFNPSPSPMTPQTVMYFVLRWEHPNHECLSIETPVEHMDFIVRGNRQGNNPYSSTYNPGWRNHCNFLQSNQG